ncbi:MAG: SDR family oxidoreductase [Caldilineaceae bacterium]|nr:SDR family oxidoreductase [Caldilineaceae bacterium]
MNENRLDPQNSHISLQGKFAVVTGSTQGLGEAAVRLFAERGAAGVIVSGRNADRGNAVAEDLRAGGCQAHFVQADLADVDACGSIVAEADRQFGALHVLVNCGALTVRGNIWDTTSALFDQMIAVNARAPFLLMQDACKLMRREGNGGAIVNISSVASYGSEQFLLPYTASKSALNAMTKNVAFAVMRYQIRVNALAVGWMDSPAEDFIQRKFHSDGEDWLEAAEREQPFGRLLKTDEVARAIAFLASDESGMMTGTIIDFDQSVRGAGPVSKPPPLDDPYWRIGAKD